MAAISKGEDMPDFFAAHLLEEGAAEVHSMWVRDEGSAIRR